MEHPPKKKVTTLHKIDFFSLNTPTRSNPASVLAAFKFYNIDLSSCQDFFYSLPSNTLHESRLAASDACLGGTPLSLSLWQPLLSWLIHLFLLISHPLTWAISPYQCHSLVQTTSDLIQISLKKRLKREHGDCVSSTDDWKKYTNEIACVLVWKYPHTCMVNPCDGKYVRKHICVTTLHVIYYSDNQIKKKVNDSEEKYW